MQIHFSRGESVNPLFMFFVFRPFYFISPILQVCSSDEPCILLGMIFCIVHGFCIKFSYWFSFIPFILHFFCAGTSLGKTQKNSTLDLLFFSLLLALLHVLHTANCLQSLLTFSCLCLHSFCVKKCSCRLSCLCLFFPLLHRKFCLFLPNN